MKKNNQVSSEALRKTLFLYLVVILFIFSLFLILTIACPIYKRFKTSENNNVHHDVEVRAIAVNEWVRRAKDLAVQVTSRPRIRQELDKYNNKEISLSRLRAFTEPKLSDAMNLSEEIMGITRLDRLGKPVVQCGENLPTIKFPIDYTGPFMTSLSVPVTLNRRRMVVVSAPILNRSKEYLGADLVLIDLFYLKHIVAGKDAAEPGCEVVLGYTAGDAPASVFTELKNIESGMTGSLLVKAFNGEKGMDDSSPDLVAAYHHLDVPDWGLVILKDKTVLYKSLNTRLAYWGLTGVLAYIAFVTGFWFLMKPLADRQLLYSDELREKIDEQTCHLEEEIKGHKHTAAALEKNIAHCRQIESDLKASDERLQLAMDFANDGLFDCDLQTGQIYYSPEWKRFLGYEDHEIPNEFSQWKRFTMAEDVEESLKRLKEALADKRSRFEKEFKMRHKKGHWVDILSRANIIFDENGDATRVVGTHVDVTDRKRAEKALKDSERKYRMIFEQSPSGIFYFSLDGIITDCNDRFAQIVGTDRAQLIGWDMLANTPEDPVRSEIEKVIESGEGHFEGEYKPVISGKKIVIKADYKAIINSDGDFLGFIGIVEDISEQKKMEEQLRQAHKMESMACLAGGIAHDFNNILFPIVGMSELLLDDLPPKSPEHENVREILKAGKRGSELVQQILAFSRQQEQKMIPLKIQRVMRDVLKLTRATIPSNIRILQDIRPDCSLVMADPTQIHQIAMNIITNAYHALEKDDGIITVDLHQRTAGDGKAPAAGFEQGEYVHLSIRDNGCGMSRGLVKKIFDPYFTTKKKGKGTGLGLAVVYGIVQAHGGEIKVESKPGKGTRFHIFLPILEDGVEAREKIESLPLPTGNESILLVDDEESVIRLEAQVLKRLGYYTTTCRDSLGALQIFSADPYDFDLVITDMTMPDLTGDRLAAALLEIRPGLPIIACTGFSERIDPDNVEKMGIKGLLVKPVAKSDMANMVRKVLDESGGEQ